MKVTLDFNLPEDEENVRKFVKSVGGGGWAGLTEDEVFKLAPIWFERETSLKEFLEIVQNILMEKNT
jgi:hypothetical protein